MTPTKLLIGQILIVLAIVVLGVWAGTQWAAAMLAYQPQLGAPWLVVGELPPYRPWALFGWWYHYEAYAPEVFDRAGALAGASGFLGCAAAVGGSLWRARQKGLVTTYGSARWASVREVEAARLFGEVGLFLGRLGGRYLRHDGPEHVLAFAPTRSGKGVGLVVPTLLSWTGSAIVHDIKGENWQLTAGWRSRFSHCLLFNPTDARSARYNPLLEVRRGVDEVRDVQNIADVLVDPVIATDRRVYRVQLESTADAAMASISWTYPRDALLALGSGAPMTSPPVAETLDLEALDFGYSIEGDEPSWRPLRAFDDGSQVFIEFPESLAQGEAPPLFVSGEGERAELVNYRVRGRFYVVDRLFAAAELRLGERRQQVVRIVRKDRLRSRRRGKSS